MQQLRSGSFARCSAMLPSDFPADLEEPANSNDFQPRLPHRTSTRSTARRRVVEDAAMPGERLQQVRSRLPAMGLTAMGLPAMALPAMGLPAMGLPAMGLPAMRSQ